MANASFPVIALTADYLMSCQWNFCIQAFSSILTRHTTLVEDFASWVDDEVFPVAETLGPLSLHGNVTTLPAIIETIEWVSSRDRTPDDYHVVFYGSAVGITTIE